jgi:hydrogenase expression/formation protein HypC
MTGTSGSMQRVAAMCLAVPLEIVSLASGQKAVVRRGAGSFEIDVSLLDAPKAGDFVLVHAGYAIGTVDRTEAEETLRLLGESDPRAGG